MPQIQVNIDKCTGCRRCEAVCAFFHTGRVNRSLSRIKILNIYDTGIDGPVLCVQCKERFCLNCPSDAISLGALGQVVISPTGCSLCGACEKACPIGAIEQFQELVFVCDLCGGKPRCVDACTEEAVLFDPLEAPGISLIDILSETRSLTPEQKRAHYLNKKGIEVRKEWRKRLA